ncbi:enoyl-CoA hydratase/isomerase family protein [Pseudonocardia kujensis]|uniref:enoyl-CoA hydratase/isomerase family protein n=1 Tax=Pseudonocardia kujensis TaxID=1128675 RepID=UPI001E2BE2DB|nr:enoyl-CoA hydratase/isomerase family protein [Pseudonocardia kujensis]MCE0762091.1 enoyl-CoA hydratase/isomerase family protein [Pseudonocardia kujensis]
MTNTDLVLLDVRDSIAWVTLNRPQQLNALSQALMQRLLEVIDAVEKHPDVRVVVVTGAGRAFSAGGDLSDFQDHLDAGRYGAVANGIAFGSLVLSRLERLPQPVIAAVNGVAVAGGLELILCCDLVIAAEGVKIGDGHLKYGILPGGGGAVRSVRRLPPAVAKQLLFTGGLERAERFEAWGLVNRVVPADHLLSSVQELANQISKLSPLALGHVKRVASAASELSTEQGLALEQEALAEYVRSHDFREGIAAFAQKRTPTFTGE